MTQDRSIKSPGRDRLNEILGADGGPSQSEVARRLTERGAKVSQSAVSQWANGHSRPEPPLRVALEVVLGIDPNLWLTAEERAVVDAVRAAPATRVGAVFTASDFPPATATGA